MAESDPYRVLGVPRTATREEIARAYRRLAKQHHPDAGAPPSPTMARINEAWYVLGSPTRRARWDEGHRVVQPPHWAAAPTPTGPRTAHRPPAPPGPPGPRTVRDSPWLAVGVVMGGAVLVAAVLVGIAVAAGTGTPAEVVRTDAFELELADGWRWFPGDGDDAPEHRVLAHLVTFNVDAAERCTSFADPCPLQAEFMPPGQGSVVVTEWRGGPPPVPDPEESAVGLGAGRQVDGSPAAVEIQRLSAGAIAWWQLSPPGFPDRWIEVRAELSGRRLDVDRRILQIDEMLDSLEFTAAG